MVPIDIVSKALANLRDNGKMQVSLSQLMQITKQPCKTVVAAIHELGLDLYEIEGEHYIVIVDMPKPKVSFSDLSLKSAIYSEAR